MGIARMTPAINVREKVARLESALENVPQVDCPVRHYFAPGLFAREITIPAGTCLVGAVHKTENLAVLSAGRLRLVTDNGTVEISAPYTLTVKPGQKNAAVAMDTAVWTNFFPNPDNETDLEKLVTRLCESSLSDMLGGGTNRQLAANKAAQLEN